MASNKRLSSARIANGEPVVDPTRETRPTARSTKAFLESRVAALEKQVERLKDELEAARAPEQPWWQKISGAFADDPAYDEAMRLGREWRESFRPKESPRK